MAEAVGNLADKVLRAIKDTLHVLHKLCGPSPCIGYHDFCHYSSLTIVTNM